MGRIRTFGLSVFFLVVGVGCSEQTEPDIELGTIEGRYVEEVSGEHFILSEEGAIIMSNESGKEEVFDKLSSGDLISIKVEVIMESYPAKTFIHDLELVEEGSEEDLPHDEIDQLIEMGRTFDLSKNH